MASSMSPRTVSWGSPQTGWSTPMASGCRFWISFATRCRAAGPRPAIRMSSALGQHKDFIIGLGMTDTLRDARHLAAAIGHGGPASIERYWRQRDVDRMPIYFWSG